MLEETIANTLYLTLNCLEGSGFAENIQPYSTETSAVSLSFQCYSFIWGLHFHSTESNCVANDLPLPNLVWFGVGFFPILFTSFD